MLRVIGTVWSAAILGAAAAHAQAVQPGDWSYGEAEFRSHAAWVMGQMGQASATLTVECEDGLPYIDFQPWGGLMGQVQGEVIYGFATDALSVPASYDSGVAEPAWRSMLSQDLYDRMQAGGTVTVQQAQSGTAVFSLTGAQTAIDQVLVQCAETARPAPAGQMPDAPTLTLAHVQGKITAACPSGGSFGEGALVQTDIDGDGFNDYVVDWGEISCPPMGRGAGFCGAALCSIDVYASSTYRPDGYPQAILGVNKEVQPFGAPFQLRVMTGRGPVEWRWTGSQLEAQ